MSHHIIEERLTGSVQVQDHKREWGHFEDITAELLQRFNKTALSYEILQAWEKKAFSTGSFSLNLNLFDRKRCSDSLSFYLLCINKQPAVLLFSVSFQMCCVFVSV
jgi:hypothetical protein